MEYLEIFKEIDFLSYIWAFAKWIFLLFAISIAILIIGTKKRFFSRNNKIANALVKTYYIIIPMYFVFFAIQFAPIRNTHNQFNEIIDNNKIVIAEFASNFIDSLNLGKSTTELSLKKAVDYQINGLLDQIETEKNKKIGVNFSFIEKVQKRITFNFLSTLVESKLISKTSKLIGIENKSGKKIYESDINELFAEGEIIDVLKIEINHAFKKFYKFLFLIFGLGLLIPVIEISLSKILKY